MSAVVTRPIQNSVANGIDVGYDTSYVMLYVCKVNIALIVGCFLPRDATQSAVMRLYVVCPSVCLSVTFWYRDHIGWNSSKIISRPNSLRSMRSLTPNMGDLVHREHPQN